MIVGEASEDISRHLGHQLKGPHGVFNLWRLIPPGQNASIFLVMLPVMPGMSDMAFLGVGEGLRLHIESFAGTYP